MPGKALFESTVLTIYKDSSGFFTADHTNLEVCCVINFLSNYKGKIIVPGLVLHKVSLPVAKVKDLI